MLTWNVGMDSIAFHHQPNTNIVLATLKKVNIINIIEMIKRILIIFFIIHYYN